MMLYSQIIELMYPGKGFSITNEDPSTIIFIDGSDSPTKEEIDYWFNVTSKLPSPQPLDE